MTAAWTGVECAKLNFGDFRMAKVCLRREGSSSANGGPSATREVVVIALHTRYAVYLSRAREKFGGWLKKRPRENCLELKISNNLQQFYIVFTLFSLFYSYK